MNRFLILLISLFLLSSASRSSATRMTLQEAYSKRRIDFQALHNPGSTHYSEPVLLRLINRQSQSIEIEIPVGTSLLPADSNQQPILVVEPQILVLGPGQKRELALKGFCMNQSKRGANDGTTYRLGKMANPKLISLAAAIHENKAFGYEGQTAVWCLTDDEGPENISGADTLAVGKLRSLVCRLTNKPMPKPEVLAGYRYNYYAPIPRTEERVGGSFEFSFSKPKSIAIAMFNKDNVVVRELYRNEQARPGKQTFNYEFDSSVYTDDVYQIKFMADGKVLMNKTLDMKSFREE